MIALTSDASILGRALIVEDNRSWQQILSEILTDAGLAVDIVDSLEAAVAALRAAPHRLAVVDLSLEGDDPHNQDGLRVLEAVRRQDPGCVAILLTGYATVELAVSVLTEYGAYTCLRKEAFRRSEFREWSLRPWPAAPLCRLPPRRRCPQAKLRRKGGHLSRTTSPAAGLGGRGRRRLAQHSLRAARRRRIRGAPVQQLWRGAGLPAPREICPGHRRPLAGGPAMLGSLWDADAPERKTWRAIACWPARAPAAFRRSWSAAWQSPTTSSAPMPSTASLPAWPSRPFSAASFCRP